MEFKHSGHLRNKLSVCASVTHRPPAFRYHTRCLSSLFAVILFAGMTTANNSYSQSENEDDPDSDVTIEGEFVPLVGTEDPENQQGNGNQTCQIVIADTGVLGTSIDNTQLSSKLFGGRAGRAQVTTTSGSFELSVDQPFGFTNMPVGGGDSVSMVTQYSGTGVTSFSETPGNINVRLENGITQVETHLTATRLSGTPYPPGDYLAEITLRCE